VRALRGQTNANGFRCAPTTIDAHTIAEDDNRIWHIDAARERHLRDTRAYVGEERIELRHPRADVRWCGARKLLEGIERLRVLVTRLVRSANVVEERSVVRITCERTPIELDGLAVVHVHHRLMTAALQISRVVRSESGTGQAQQHHD